ncbi:hypothetical protein [Citricoccus sp. GCM10030269]|uniref:hypothetical protein n=1 Tax=Citricoccus sp. GCM10030269 TaxID=3273388 RepID=UPI00361BF97A
MNLTLHQGNALAHAAAALRPEWTPEGCGTVLARGNTGDGLPATDFPHAMQALVQYAADPANETFGQFTATGAHWDTTTRSPKENTMTTTASKTTRLYVLDQATELGLVQQVLPGMYAADMRVSTKLTITGTPQEDLHGWADLTVYDDDHVEQAKVGMDAAQARALAAYLLQIADELDARTEDDRELKTAA